MNNKEVLLWLNSIRSVGNKTIDKLEKYYGEIHLLWEASNNEIRGLDFLNDKIKADIIKNKNIEYYSKQREKIQQQGLMVITVYDENYPEGLRTIYNRPKVLYVKGEIKEEDKLSISIVGSRKATAYGRWAAEKFAEELAKMGITIVSGMARGVDTLAHLGALQAKGRTLAILGSGADVIYPKSNRQLYNNICSNGAVISEFPPGTEPLQFHFPLRNRIISGLGLGVVVIEASEKSGSLITAQHAMEQGKDIFALPGNINSIYSKGTNLLIKDGAKILTDIDDILEEIDVLRDKCSYYSKKTINFENFSHDEERIVKSILEKPLHLDMISYNCDMSISKVTSVLTILEMKGVVKQLPGKIFTII